MEAMGLFLVFVATDTDWLWPCFAPVAALILMFDVWFLTLN